MCRTYWHGHLELLVQQTFVAICHWLPLSHRVTFKLCLITWKTLYTAQSPYLSELITHYLSPRAVHSSNSNLLILPFDITANFSC